MDTGDKPLGDRVSRVRRIPAAAIRALIPIGVLAVALTAGLAPAPVARAQDACTDCHDVDLDRLAASAHGFLDCADCHAGTAEVPHGDEVELPSCGDCHPDVAEGVEEGVHGEVKRAAGESWLASCLDCHGDAHALLPAADPESPTHPTRLAETCGACHADPTLAERLGFRLVQPIEAYLASVHARAVDQGEDGATCSSCHGSHAIFRAVDPRSSVNRQRVPETCGQCHGEIAETYSKSVHGQAAAHGIRESPVCTDCHGEHRILDPGQRESPVFASNIPKLTCGRCHGDLRLSEKFDLPPDQVPSYEDSFHGLASRAGAVTVAHCGSCHGVHDILPSSDPASHTNPANLPATCGQCHPGAGTVFAIGPVHVLPNRPVHPAVYWVRIAYLWAIFLVIAAMLLHNALDLYRKARRPPLRPAAALPDAPERMSRPFRIAHGMLAASFLVLVYTGFALKFPEAWWARPLLGWEDRIGLRGLIHRIAAVAMLAAGVFHLGHLAVDREARRCIAGMRPGRADLRELRERLRYLFGRRPDPPPAPTLGYPEKAEYLAVVWGTVVMAATGLLLWFETPALHWLPSWGLDLATAIHFYEAVLASLAILVWHFYGVIFDPVVSPMDPSWLTGRSAPGRQAERDAEGAGPAEPPEPPESPAAPETPAADRPTDGPADRSAGGPPDETG
jgi:cytochrome b subunit of formate dehydrogenase